MTTIGISVLLLVVVVFMLFMMIRKGGGCCGSGNPGVGDESCCPPEGHGETHNHHAGHDQTTDIDPVCGMTVDPASDLTSEYHGKRYLFCSEHCKKNFEAEPDKYVK